MLHGDIGLSKKKQCGRCYDCLMPEAACGVLPDLHRDPKVQTVMVVLLRFLLLLVLLCHRCRYRCRNGCLWYRWR